MLIKLLSSNKYIKYDNRSNSMFIQNWSIFDNMKDRSINQIFSLSISIPHLIFTLHLLQELKWAGLWVKGNVEYC